MVSGFKTSPLEFSRISSGEAKPIEIFEKLLFKMCIRDRLDPVSDVLRRIWNVFVYDLQHLQYPKSVSDTHLDVYKRQPLPCGAGLILLSVAPPSTKILVTNSSPLSALRDVYKRQHDSLSKNDRHHVSSIHLQRNILSSTAILLVTHYLLRILYRNLSSSLHQKNSECLSLIHIRCV